jgi:hypothetical protein
VTDRSNDLLKALGVDLPDAPEPEAAPAPVDPLPGWQTAAAKSYGLPEALAPRLAGRSEAEVFADASRLSKELAAPKSPRAEALALARKAVANAEKVRDLGPGIRGGKLAPAPIEMKEPTRPERLIWQDSND